MDVTLSPSSIKIFTSSIVCFSRIAGSSNTGGGGNASASQQDLYWEFDPITGLVIRTMNDAKTAYACMSYQPNFFCYCSTNTNNTTASSNTSNNNMEVMSTSQQTCSQNTTTSSSTSTNNTKRQRSDRTFVCRITIKALIPIVRHRNNKNIESLRIRSYYENSLDRSRNTASATTDATAKHKIHQSQPLGLEFIFTLRNTKTDQNQFNHHLNRSTNGITNNYERLVIHRIPIVDSTATAFGNVMTPMMHRDKDEPPSELIVSPNVLYRLLEPLQRTVEVALIIRSHTATNQETDEEGALGRHFNNIQNSLGSVSASSFHHSDTVYDRTLLNNNNAILQATTASLLKTETACTSQEFEDFDFVTSRNMNSNDNNGIPDNVNDEVILVFPIKEAKAMLQFCCSSFTMLSVSQQHRLQHVENQLVHLSFHWGGQPLMIQTFNNTANSNIIHDNNIESFSSSTYNMQLVLATMDYQLLTSMRTTTTSAAQQ